MWTKATGHFYPQMRPEHAPKRTLDAGKHSFRENTMGLADRDYMPERRKTARDLQLEIHLPWACCLFCS